MKYHKLVRVMVIFLSILPFVFCLALPIVLAGGDLRQIGKCLVCRLGAMFTRVNQHLC